MSGIRLADIPDVRAIVELGRELLEQSVYAGIKPDEQKFRMLVAGLIGNKRGAVFVVVDDEDKPQGFLLGIIDELFFSTQRFATDMAVYVREGYRQHAPALYKRFLKWAESKPRVVQITMGISSGMPGIERAGKLYESFGFSPVGGLYMKRVES